MIVFWELGNFGRISPSWLRRYVLQFISYKDSRETLTRSSYYLRGLPSKENISYLSNIFYSRSASLSS